MSGNEVGAITASLAFRRPDGGWPHLDVSQGLAAMGGWEMRVVGVNVAVTTPMMCGCGHCEPDAMTLVTGHMVLPGGEVLDTEDPTTLPVADQHMPPWLASMRDEAVAAARVGVAAMRKETP